MPHHPDENGPVIDDRLLVRPYVAHGGRPSRRAAPHRTGAPPWPRHTPEPAPAPAPRAEAATAAVPTAAPAPAPEPPTAGRREHGTRNSLVVLALLALLTTGTLLALLHSPPDDPPRPVSPPAAAGPRLLGRSPGAEEPAASSTGSVRPSAPAPSASAPAASGSPSPGRSPSSGGPVVERPPTPTAPTGGGTLRPGDSGAEVRTLQERLFAQGFTYVSVSGVYDEQTRRGVRQFQRDRGLTGDPSGIYGPRTRAAMDGS
ncbi:peptidoglycan-binding protein [Streptomyces sp. NBC_00536]|uniref:peptidoglycan-binding domain-containing protein n=1 Tax=Streptomyces sp. NBC_00536 TaxID=2975769 RepID=UPI002E808FBC|nr:peptidoglycan-binding domain-containing protein [Streptomyces sp. NBC_00536]WUC77250.1 peptidoglycan-binding protein [Streptomyces sp. NBC_00536]